MHGMLHDTPATQPPPDDHSAWVEDQFVGGGPYLDGLRSAARIALHATPDQRSTAFINAAREAFGYADKEGIGREAIAEAFGIIAERNSLLDEIGHEGVEGLLAEAQAGASIDRLPTPMPEAPAEQAVTPKFEPVAIDDITATLEPAWCVYRILPARGLAAIVGAPKSGKSFITSDMLLSVARNVPYAGRDVLAGPVIYATGEGVNGFKRRLVAMRRHHGIEGQGVPFFMIENVPDLGSETTDLPQLLAELDAFVARTQCGRPRAIVLDTLARCMGNGDESAARDMGRFVTRCGALERHFGCLVVVVHHMGKDTSKGARGSNALNGAADVILTVEKSGTGNRVEVTEMKDGPEGQEWRFRLVPVDLSETSGTPYETSSEVSTCVVELLTEPGEAKPKAKPPAKPPKGVKGDLLKVIRRAIEEAGERDADSSAVPRGTTAVSRDNVKRYCGAMAWQEPDGKPDAFRAMLAKTLSQLRADDWIGMDRSWVWMVQP